MEHWISVELKRRREELLRSAARPVPRSWKSGRSRGLRGYMANRAQSLSELFAGFAQVLRNEEV